MKRHFLSFIFLIPAFVIFGQNQIIQGQIMDQETSRPVPGAKIIRLDSLIDAQSDANGFFLLGVPANGELTLVFSHPDYHLTKRNINPQDIKTPLLINLTPMASVSHDSLIRRYKNTLAFAPVELVFLGLTFEYERRFTLKHAVGSYATGLLNQGAWMLNHNTSGVTLKGIKIEPFYRFYVMMDGLKDIGFVQVKLVYANFTINDHHYSQPTIVTPAQCFGIGVAWGWKLMHRKFPRHSIELVLGAKFVPFITEDESMNDLIKNYRREYWWNVVGPGAVFDIKFSLGGIF